MGGMPDIILKGEFLRILERAAPTARKEDRDDTLEWLGQKERDLVWILEQRGFVTSEAEKEHMQNWLRMWPGTEEIMRKTFLEAIKLLDSYYDPKTKRTVPLDAYWICGVPEVQGVVSDRRTHVTMILLTPAPPPSTGDTPDPTMTLIKRENGKVTPRPVIEGPYP